MALKVECPWLPERLILFLSQFWAWNLFLGEAHLFDPGFGIFCFFGWGSNFWPRFWHFLAFLVFSWGFAPFEDFFLNFVFFALYDHFVKYYITSFTVEHLFGDAILLVKKVHNCGLSLYEESFASLFRLILRYKVH